MIKRGSFFLPRLVNVHTVTAAHCARGACMPDKNIKKFPLSSPPKKGTNEVRKLKKGLKNLRFSVLLSL